MQKREWAHQETPVFEVVLSLADASTSDVLLEGTIVRDDGVEVGTFTDRVMLSQALEVKRQYGLSIPEWKAGYYYVVLKVSSRDTDQTVIRRVTFSLRPNVAARFVYGGTGAAALLGIGLIAYVFFKRREHV